MRFLGPMSCIILASLCIWYPFVYVYTMSDVERNCIPVPLYSVSDFCIRFFFFLYQEEICSFFFYIHVDGFNMEVIVILLINIPDCCLLQSYYDNLLLSLLVLFNFFVFCMLYYFTNKT